MAAGAAQVAILGPGRAPRTVPGAHGGELRARVGTLIGFALLGGYGILRWSTMLAHPAAGRIAGLVALAVAVAGLGAGAHASRGIVRGVAIAAIAVAAVAVLPVAGFPLHWITHVRIAVLARAIGRGLSDLPGVLVPYSGASHATQAVIVLGGGLLLLGGALTLAGSRHPVGELRLAAAALPVLVLAIVPSALAAPQVPYLHGTLLFALLAAFVFSERIAHGRAFGALTLLTVCAAGGLLIGPAIAGDRAWFDFETMTAGTGTGGAGGSAETFDWAQTYGPLLWPQRGGTVLQVRARFPYYWKAQDLDLFNGRQWVSAAVGGDAGVETVSSATLARYTQSLTVTVRGMRTSDLIAAGEASPPDLPGRAPVFGGSAPGTFVTESVMPPGTRYRVQAYTPDPPVRALAAAPAAYPAAASSDLQLTLELGGGATGQPVTLPPEQLQFAPYGAPGAIDGRAGIPPAQAEQEIRDSVYGPVFALAERLKAGTSTPYGYVQAVLRYLSHGFVYDQNPPVGTFPLITFLTRTHRGYCQQFAGAMALLLRMGGIPARVAAGFTTGDLDRSSGAYVVTDTDAHAWVEAWFHGYGWVKFDPTPPTAPARARSGGVLPALGTGNRAPKPGAVGHRDARGGGRSGSAGHRAGGRAPSPWLWLVPLLVLLTGAGGAAAAAGHRRRAGVEDLLDELERAFRRCGRPLPPGTTLAAIEARFADAPEAAAYVRVLRRARYAGADVRPSAAQRRAVRARLRQGLGPFGRPRALAALPPLPHRPRIARPSPTYSD
jgi:transglutaminase-like putative cysteine protease